MSAELTENLIILYQNEKSSPLLLKYNTTVIEQVMYTLRNQIHYVSNCSFDSVIKNIYEYEIERIKWFVKEYIQIRVRKILNNFYEKGELMSDQEKQLQTKYVYMMKDRDIYVDREDDMEYFVGFVCLRNINPVVVDGTPIEMLKGDFYITHVSDVKDLLNNGDILLF